MWNIVVRDAQGRDQAQKALHEGSITFGRDLDCDVVLPSKAVSRKHARLEVRGSKLFLIDEGSANGCMVDGQRVTTPVEVGESSAIFIPPFRIVVLPITKAESGQGEATLVIRRPETEAKAAASPGQSGGTPQSTVGEDSWSWVTAKLDQQIQGIRSHRERDETTTQTRLAELEQSWARLISAMQKLKAQLASHPRLRSFDITRDQKEVAVKIEDRREKLGYRYFLLSRHHPDGKFTGMQAVWLREPGKEDQSFPDPQEAASELVQRIAATLA